MAPTGAHGIIGLALARTTRNPRIKLGLVLGSVAPDLDLTIGMVLVLLGWTDTSKAVHRTFSHSLLAIITLAVLSAIFIVQAYRIHLQQMGWLLIGVVVGMLVHILMDMLLWTPLPLLWPLDLDVGPILFGDAHSPGPTEDQPPIAVLPGHILFLVFIGLIEFWGIYTKKIDLNRSYCLAVVFISLLLVLLPVLAMFFFSTNDFRVFFDFWSYLISIPLMFLFPIFRRDSVGCFWDMTIENQEMTH